MNEADLAILSAMMRQIALSFDDAGHPLREMAFHNWQRDTVFPTSVDRWVREIGERV